MSKINYKLTFQEALDAVMNDKAWVQGEDFKDGVVLMKYDGFGAVGANHLHCHDFNASISSKQKKFELRITTGIFNQKYRLIETEPEAKRNI